MKKILIICTLCLIGKISTAQKTIAILPAKVSLRGNLPKDMRNNEKAQQDLRRAIGKDHQMALANEFARQNRRNKNRGLRVNIITPPTKDYQADLVVSSQFVYHRNMSATAARAINTAAAFTNFNTPYRMPYARPAYTISDFSIYRAGTDNVAWNRNGHLRQKVRRLYRDMRKGRVY